MPQTDAQGAEIVSMQAISQVIGASTYSLEPKAGGLERMRTRLTGALELYSVS